MKKLTLIVAIICISFPLANAEESKPKGNSVICHDIGYLSVGTGTCEDVEVLEMKYYDKDVALADASSDKINETSNVNVKIDVEALMKRIRDNQKKYKSNAVKQIITWEED